MSKYDLNLYDPFFEDELFPMFKANNSHSNHLMRSDIKELDNEYELSVELPGVKKNDISLALDNGYLTVKYEHKDEVNKKEKGKYIKRERYYGEMSRSYYVGKNVKEEDISASYNDGVLKVIFPKEIKEHKEVKKIEIK